MRRNKSGITNVLGLLVVGVLAAGVLYLSNNLSNFGASQRGSAAGTADQTITATLVASEPADVTNEDGGNFTTGGNSVWIGNGASKGSSYLGLRFKGDAVPKNAQIQSAELQLLSSSEQWIPVSVAIYAEKSGDPGVFYSGSKPSSRSLTSTTTSSSDNVKWLKDSQYSYNVKDVIQELVGSTGFTTTVLVVKGTGNAYGRKFIYGNFSGKQPKLVITYKSEGATALPTVRPTNPSFSAQPSSTATAKPTLTPSLTPTQTPTARPTIIPVVTTTAVPTPSPTSGTTGTTILGLVSADLLGTCSEAAHNKYVVKGPDGNTYRTWHPARDPSGCTYAHEHGDDPATSRIYSGRPVAFGYAAFKMDPPKDEPHAGVKCFVHNAGTRNDEGGVALHDSYYCFHMGTGGAARFGDGARFHTIEFNVRTSGGATMRIMGMADTGNVGDICSNPRQQRTVQAFGCKLDSAYEIWENVLNIRNKGQTVATAITSVAVFDPITSMDPADRTRTIYSWSDEAQQKIFKFVNDRNDYRGCDREAYSGPLSWYNRGGSQVYYTDVYGNVVNGGPLRQEISLSNNNDAGALTQFGGLIMAYKGGSDPQAQFKYRKSACVPGLGIKN